MRSTETSIEGYFHTLADDRKTAMMQLFEVVKQNLPPGFEENMSYGMIGFAVPLSDYPDGYHCAPNTPLPFINMASQKNFIALYHMGLYCSEDLLKWFVEEYTKTSKSKLDMGKSCIRFKKMDQIPFELIGQLCSKISPKQWIEWYEKAYKRKK